MLSLRRCVPFGATFAMVFLVGCSFSGTNAPVANSVAAAVSGKVMGGQQPVRGATVSVFAVGTDDYGTGDTLLATTTSDPVTGTFEIPAGTYTCPYANTPVYILAQGGDSGSGANASLTLAAGLGLCSSAETQNVNINEVTTAATAYAMGQFFTATLGAASADNFGAYDTGVAGTYAQGIVSADVSTIPTLVNLPLGTVNASTAAVKIEAAKIDSIANVLAACVNSTGATSATDTTTVCGQLFAATTPPGATTRPSDTLQAAVQMSLYPYQNVAALYSLGAATPPFAGLSAAPNDWTVGVSYTTDGLGMGVSGSDIANGMSSSIDIDTTGHIWFPTNDPANPGVGNFDPSTNMFGGPYGVGYVGYPQYVAIDQEGYVWATDQDSDNVIEVDPSNPEGEPGDGYITGVTGGPIADNWDDTLFFGVEDTQTPILGTINIDRTEIGEVSYLLYPPTSMTPQYFGQDSYGTEYFEIQMSNSAGSVCDVEGADTQDGEWGDGDFQSPGTISPCVSGGSASAIAELDVIGTATSANQLCSANDGCFAPPVPVNLPEGIATDGYGNEWIANSGDGSISTLGTIIDGSSGTPTLSYVATSPIEYMHNSTNGGTMTTPYGLAIDGSGNVWTANAGCVTASTTPCTATSFTLSELIGAAAPTITPLGLQLGGIFAGSEPSSVPVHTATSQHNSRLVQKKFSVANHLVMHRTGTMVRR